MVSGVIVSSREISREEVASHYDELDRFYREIWGDHVHHGFWETGRETRQEAVRALVQRLAHEAQITAGTRVCDIGCGYGATSRMLAREYGAQCVGMTISAAQYAVAARADRAEKNVDFLLGDWLENSLPDASFDVAIAVESSEHMPDQRGFFTQAHRVLRSGGRLVACVWLAGHELSPTASRWLMEPICREGRMPRLLTSEELIEHARSAGFHLENFADVSSKVSRTWLLIVRQFLVFLFRRPSYLRFLLNQHAHNRIFALTIFRIWIAYRCGAMRYGIFTFSKPESFS